MYESPYSGRYGSPEMRTLWSEKIKRATWRRIWTSVAEAQVAAGLVSAEQIDDIRQNSGRVNIQRALEIEADIGHDLMAELKTFAEQCSIGGGVLHWGLTSADVQDNAEIVRQRAGLAILLGRLKKNLLLLADHIETLAEMPIMGYTHLQPAEPTTLGYRFAGYAQDLMMHFDRLVRLRSQLSGKGITGAVGTAAPFVEMLEGTSLSAEMLESTTMQALGIPSFLISTQTYPRVQDYYLLTTLAATAASLHKMAFDLRLMQSPGFKTTAEPFGEHQVGSSAMPFKRNPIKAEKICSLARQIAEKPASAWQNCADALLERTLDDSANRRNMIPESFLAMDEILLTLKQILSGLVIDEYGIQQSLKTYGPFAAIERLLSALVRAGADRQQMHERLRLHSLKAWDDVAAGKPNPLSDCLQADTALLQYLQPARIQELLNADTYVGSAPQRARQMAAQIRQYFTTK